MTNNALSTVTLCLQGRKQVGGCLARKQQNWGTNLVLQVPRETSGPPPIAPGKMCLPCTDLISFSSQLIVLECFLPGTDNRMNRDWMKLLMSS